MALNSDNIQYGKRDLYEVWKRKYEKENDADKVMCEGWEIGGEER